jgi:hypothetical protein
MDGLDVLEANINRAIARQPRNRVPLEVCQLLTTCAGTVPLHPVHSVVNCLLITPSERVHQAATSQPMYLHLTVLVALIAGESVCVHAGQPQGRHMCSDGRLLVRSLGRRIPYRTGGLQTEYALRSQLALHFAMHVLESKGILHPDLFVAHRIQFSFELGT